MALKETMDEMDGLIEYMRNDLPNIKKSKTAAARVRKNSLAFGRVAKVFRKESVAFHNKG